MRLRDNPFEIPRDNSTPDFIESLSQPEHENQGKNDDTLIMILKVKTLIICLKLVTEETASKSLRNFKISLLPMFLTF